MRFAADILQQSLLLEVYYMKSLQQQAPRTNLIRFFILLVLYSLLIFLFFNQASTIDNTYRSDLPTHIQLGLNGEGYSLAIALVAFLYKVTNSAFIVALFESTLVVMTFLLAEKYLRNTFTLSAKYTIFISFGLLFLCSILLPFLPFQTYYVGSFITQPWHNITYLGMRMLSIPVFFNTLEVIDRYQQQFSLKNWLSISLPLLICTAVKPNFLVCYSFTLLLILIIDFVKAIINKTITLNLFLKYVYLGTVVFPSLAILLFQSTMLFGAQNAAPSGITLTFGSSYLFSHGKKFVFIHLLRDLLLPVLFFVCLGKQFCKKDFFVFLLFAIGILQYVFLQETGFRELHGNFTWGCLLCGYLAYLYFIPRVIPFILDIPWHKKTLRNKVLCVSCAGLMCGHLYAGLTYFSIVLSGSAYFI